MQTNENIGFDNFEKYQNRKEDFIEDTPLEKEYIKMALKEDSQMTNLNSLFLSQAYKDCWDDYNASFSLR